jgi:hypothetical protein
MLETEGCPLTKTISNGKSVGSLFFIADSRPFSKADDADTVTSAE